MITRTNIQTDELKGENYIPLSINAGVIKIHIEELQFLSSASRPISHPGNGGIECRRCTIENKFDLYQQTI